MKTMLTAFAVALLSMPYPVQSNFTVDFGVDVKIEKSFNPKEYNFDVVKGDIKPGKSVTIGKHSDYLLALKDKYIIVNATGNKAEVTAKFHDETITLDDAFSLMNDMNYIEKEGTEIEKIESSEFYYSLEILTNEIQTLDNYLAICPELEKYIAQKDQNVFIIGKLKSHKSAIAIQEKFTSAGLVNNIIVAFEGNKQVPVYLVAKAK